MTGKVSEYSGQTQISLAAVTDTVVVTAGVGVPAPTPLPYTVVGADHEQYENMLATPTSTYRLASSHQLYNYGKLWLNADESLNVKSTESTRPGAARRPSRSQSCQPDPPRRLVDPTTKRPLSITNEIKPLTNKEKTPPRRTRPRRTRSSPRAATPSTPSRRGPTRRTPASPTCSRRWTGSRPQDRNA